MFCFPLKLYYYFLICSTRWKSIKIHNMELVWGLLPPSIITYFCKVKIGVLMVSCVCYTCFSYHKYRIWDLLEAPSARALRSPSPFSRAEWQFESSSGSLIQSLAVQNGRDISAFPAQVIHQVTWLQQTACHVVELYLEHLYLAEFRYAKAVGW